MKNTINKLEKHIEKREKLDHALSISILKNKLWYWEAIRAKTNEKTHPEAWECADDAVKKLKKSVDILEKN